MRVLIFIVCLMLSNQANAARTHVYGLTKKSSIYIIHKKIPEWAVEGEGLLWHWDYRGLWWQCRGNKAIYLNLVKTSKRVDFLKLCPFKITSVVISFFGDIFQLLLSGSVCSSENTFINL